MEAFSITIIALVSISIGVNVYNVVSSAYREYKDKKEHTTNRDYERQIMESLNPTMYHNFLLWLSCNCRECKKTQEYVGVESDILTGSKNEKVSCGSS